MSSIARLLDLTGVAHADHLKNVSASQSVHPRAPGDRGPPSPLTLLVTVADEDVQIVIATAAMPRRLRCSD